MSTWKGFVGLVEILPDSRDEYYVIPLLIRYNEDRNHFNIHRIYVAGKTRDDIPYVGSFLYWAQSAFGMCVVSLKINIIPGS